jgi:hypothetical protein
MSEPVRLLGVKLPRRGPTQFGVASVLLFDWLTVTDLQLHRKGGRIWCQLPRGGRWRTPQAVDRFNKLVVGLVAQHYPDITQHGQADAPLLRQAARNTTSSRSTQVRR